MRIETERLILRDFIYEDWKQVHEYASKDEVTQYTIWGPNTEEDTKRYVEEQISKQQAEVRTDYEFAVVLKDSNLLIGGCGIYVADHNAEVGYSFNPVYWGKGYATEAAHAILKLGFETFHVHRIYATCRPGNIPSANVMKRLGMKQEGHLREHLWFKGRFHDSYLFSILKNEFDS
jgi:ribosomal-protein-alanine N-acetyltransferase